MTGNSLIQLIHLLGCGINGKGELALLPHQPISFTPDCAIPSNALSRFHLLQGLLKNPNWHLIFSPLFALSIDSNYNALFREWVFFRFSHRGG